MIGQKDKGLTPAFINRVIHQLLTKHQWKQIGATVLGQLKGFLSQEEVQKAAQEDCQEPL